MSPEYKVYVFRTDDWDDLDHYWNSPFSYWLVRAMCVDPGIELRVRVLGRTTAHSTVGWINYGGAAAMLLHTVQGRGTRGQQVRIEICHAAITEEVDQP